MRDPGRDTFLVVQTDFHGIRIEHAQSRNPVEMVFEL